MRDWLVTVLELTGAVCLVAGTAMVNAALAVVVAGALAMLAAWSLAR